jgi:hypothetical protein
LSFYELPIILDSSPEINSSTYPHHVNYLEQDSRKIKAHASHTGEIFYLESPLSACGLGNCRHHLQSCESGKVTELKEPCSFICKMINL